MVSYLETNCFCELLSTAFSFFELLFASSNCFLLLRTAFCFFELLFASSNCFLLLRASGSFVRERKRARRRKQMIYTYTYMPHTHTHTHTHTHLHTHLQIHIYVYIHTHTHTHTHTHRAKHEECMECYIKSGILAQDSMFRVSLSLSLSLSLPHTPSPTHSLSFSLCDAPRAAFCPRTLSLSSLSLSHFLSLSFLPPPISLFSQCYTKAEGELVKES